MCPALQKAWKGALNPDLLGDGEGLETVMGNGGVKLPVGNALYDTETLCVGAYHLPTLLPGC